MNLVELNSQFSTEDKCREFLKCLRWPEGVKIKQQMVFRCHCQSPILFPSRLLASP
jgi:hypothetical protein